MEKFSQVKNLNIRYINILLKGRFFLQTQNSLLNQRSTCQ